MMYASFYIYGELVQNLYDNLNCIGKEVDPFKIYKHWRALLKINPLELENIMFKNSQCGSRSGYLHVE